MDKYKSGFLNWIYCILETSVILLNSGFLYDFFTLADLGGTTGVHPPMGSNSFVSTYDFAEKSLHQRSAPPTAWLPPTGNPGSTTALCNVM